MWYIVASKGMHPISTGRIRLPYCWYCRKIEFSPKAILLLSVCGIVDVNFLLLSFEMIVMCGWVWLPPPLYPSVGDFMKNEKVQVRAFGPSR
jgi:hypothetical protein